MRSKHKLSFEFRGAKVRKIEIRDWGLGNIYPNPAKDETIIETLGLKKGNILTMTDIEGNEILQQQLRNEKTKISLAGIPPGIYFLSIRGDHETIIRKLVKMK